MLRRLTWPLVKDWQEHTYQSKHPSVHCVYCSLRRLYWQQHPRTAKWTPLRKKISKSLRQNLGRKPYFISVRSRRFRDVYCRELCRNHCFLMRSTQFLSQCKPQSLAYAQCIKNRCKNCLQLTVYKNYKVFISLVQVTYM